MYTYTDDARLLLYTLTYTQMAQCWGCARTMAHMHSLDCLHESPTHIVDQDLYVLLTKIAIP